MTVDQIQALKYLYEMESDKAEALETLLIEVIHKLYPAGEPTIQWLVKKYCNSFDQNRYMPSLQFFELQLKKEQGEKDDNTN